MTEIEQTDAIIMGFLKWASKTGKDLDVYTQDEIEDFIDKYMRSLVAGG